MGTDSFTFCSRKILELFKPYATSWLTLTEKNNDSAVCGKKPINVEVNVLVLVVDIFTEMNCIIETFLVGFFFFLGSLTYRKKFLQSFRHGGRLCIGRKHVLENLKPASYSTIKGVTRKVSSELVFGWVLQNMRKTDKVLYLRHLEVISFFMKVT